MFQTEWSEVGSSGDLGGLDLGPLKERLHRQVIDALDLAIVASLHG